jgi:hypothetical protein
MTARLRSVVASLAVRGGSVKGFGDVPGLGLL